MTVVAAVVVASIVSPSVVLGSSDESGEELNPISQHRENGDSCPCEEVEHIKYHCWNTS